jgi:hypothetical protein
MLLCYLPCCGKFCAPVAIGRSLLWQVARCIFFELKTLGLGHVMCDDSAQDSHMVYNHEVMCLWDDSCNYGLMVGIVTVLSVVLYEDRF